MQTDNLAQNLITPTPYQATLPYVRGHDDGGQWELFDGASIGELGEHPELAQLDVETLNLFESVGVFRHATKWRRYSDGGPKAHRSWRQLDLALAWRDVHRGAGWQREDLDVLEDVRAQTWNRQDVERQRFRVRWLAGAFVSPLDGAVINVPSNPGAREMLDIAINAAASGTGGIWMSREDWAAVLGCSPRSIWNHRKRLGRLIRASMVWQPATNDCGEQIGCRKGFVLVRVGPDIEALAALQALTRRAGAGPGAKARYRAARLVGASLLARASRRRFDVAGAFWRGERRAAVNTRKLRESNWQVLPISPPLTGLCDPPPVGGPLGASPPSNVTRSASRTTVAVRTTEPTAIDSTPPAPAPTNAARGEHRLEGGRFDGPATEDATPMERAFDAALGGGDLVAALRAATDAMRY